MRRVGFFFLLCHLSQKQNTVSLKVCPLGRYGLYVESIFSHCLVVSSVFLALVVTDCGYPKVAIFTTNVHAENQTLINHKCVCGVLNRHFCQTRVTSSISSAIFHHTLRLCPRSRTFLFVVKSCLQVVRLPCSILLFLLSPSCVLSSNA